MASKQQVTNHQAMRATMTTGKGSQTKALQVKNRKAVSQIDVFQPSIQSFRPSNVAPPTIIAGKNLKQVKVTPKTSSIKTVTPKPSNTSVNEQQSLQITPTQHRGSMASNSSPTRLSPSSPKSIQKKVEPFKEDASHGSSPRRVSGKENFLLVDVELEFEKSINSHQMMQMKSQHIIPTAKQELQQKNGHHCSGLTGIRTASDFFSSEKSSGNSSDFFDADSNQDLHSCLDTNAKKIFAKVIFEKLDSQDSIERPQVLPIVNLETEESKEPYDLAKAEKKQQDVAFVSKFISDDIRYQIKDIERQVKKNEKVKEASKEIKEQSDLLGKKLDTMMARFIQANNFEELVWTIQEKIDTNTVSEAVVEHK